MIAASVGGSVGTFGGDDTSLAAQVLHVSEVLAQEEGAKEGGQYTFPLEDDQDAGARHGCFQLSRDDTLQLIGLLNSSEIDIAKHQLGSLLQRLDRPAIEGLTRRLFATLRRRSTELGALLEAKAVRTASVAARIRQPGTRSHGALPGTPTSGGSATPRTPGTSTPTLGGSFTAAVVRPTPRSRVRSPDAAQSSERAASSDRVMAIIAEAAPTRSPRTSGERGEMPSVFRRLSAPPGGAAVDEYSRARIALATTSSPDSPSTGPPMTIAGIPTSDEGPQASAYLEALLEAHEIETGHPASSSRRMPSEEREMTMRRLQKVPEEQAKQIFDRLYASGKAYRVRRRVYQELGLLVEQAREAQTCTFEPNVPGAQYARDYQPGSVSERLYRDGVDRRRRREEMARHAPVPTFRPQTVSGRRELQPLARLAAEGEEGGMSPASVVDENGVPIQGDEGAFAVQQGDDADARVAGSALDAYSAESPHHRLYREHAERLARRSRREEHEAEWRKHSYRPDISSSQASGPQVLRQQGVLGYMVDVSRDTDEEQVHFASVVAAGDEAGGALPLAREEELEHRRVPEIVVDFQEVVHPAEQLVEEEQIPEQIDEPLNPPEVEVKEEAPQFREETHERRHSNQSIASAQHITTPIVPVSAMSAMGGGSLAAQAAAALPIQAPAVAEAFEDAPQNMVVNGGEGVDEPEIAAPTSLDGTLAQLPTQAPTSVDVAPAPSAAVEEINVPQAIPQQRPIEYYPTGGYSTTEAQIGYTTGGSLTAGAAPQPMPAQPMPSQPMPSQPMQTAQTSSPPATTRSSNRLKQQATVQRQSSSTNVGGVVRQSSGGPMPLVRQSSSAAVGPVPAQRQSSGAVVRQSSGNQPVVRQASGLQSSGPSRQVSSPNFQVTPLPAPGSPRVVQRGYSGPMVAGPGAPQAQILTTAQPMGSASSMYSPRMVSAPAASTYAGIAGYPQMGPPAAALQQAVRPGYAQQPYGMPMMGLY